MQHCEYIAVYSIILYRSCYRNNNIVKHFFLLQLVKGVSLRRIFSYVSVHVIWL